MKQRRLLAWIAALPIVLVGSQLAHSVAYWWAYPQADLRASVLQASGHAYLAYAPMLLAVAVAVELLVLCVTAFEAARRLPAGELPAWIFFVLPLLAFALQEHLERLIATGMFPWWAALDPTFWRGLVLQVPVGLLAWAVARLLLRTATAVGRLLGGSGPRRLLRPELARALTATAGRAFRIAPIASSAAGRAPPFEVV